MIVLRYGDADIAAIANAKGLEDVRILGRINMLRLKHLELDGHSLTFSFTAGIDYSPLDVKAEEIILRGRIVENRLQETSSDVLWESSA